MVVVAAIMGQRDGPSAAVIDTVATGGVELAIRDDQLAELVRVMGYEDIQGTIQGSLRAFEVALDFGTMGFMYHPRRLDWPSLRDPKVG